MLIGIGVAEFTSAKKYNGKNCGQSDHGND